MWMIFALGTLMGLAAMACGVVMRKTIGMGGMISMLDNVNRILDRVSVYLA